MSASHRESEPGRPAAPAPRAERTTRLLIGDPADGVRSIEVHGLLDQAGSVRLLRLIDSRLETGADDPRGLRALLIDLTEAEVRGHGAANVLAHAADACERRRIEFAVVEPPCAGATPSSTGRGRYRAHRSIEEAVHAFGRSDDGSEEG